MLQMRPNCECCDVDLPADGSGVVAMICSFECTFCSACAVNFTQRCPNCDGDLMARPPRPAAMLGRFPGSTERVLKPHEGCAAVA
jgi:hypothetical protein